MTNDNAFENFILSDDWQEIRLHTQNSDELAEKVWQAAISYMQEQSEPVAWAWKARQPNGQILQRVEMWNPISKHVPIDSHTVFDVTPLFTSPPQRQQPLKRLSLERVMEIYNEMGDAYITDIAIRIMDEMIRINK